MEKYYIVYRDSRKGYYVGYKNKIEDEYNNNFIFAKRYKTLGAALTRAGLSYDGSRAIKLISKLENNEDIFEHSRIEIVKIPNERKRKLSKLNNQNCDSIQNLGEISNNQLIDYFRKIGDKFLSSYEGKYYGTVNETATEEYIDEWCNHMDNIFNNN